MNPTTYDYVCQSGGGLDRDYAYRFIDLSGQRRLFDEINTAYVSGFIILQNDFRSVPLAVYIVVFEGDICVRYERVF